MFIMKIGFFSKIVITNFSVKFRWKIARIPTVWGSNNERLNLAFLKNYISQKRSHAIEIKINILKININFEEYFLSKARNRKILVYQWFLSYQRLSREVRGYFRNKDLKIFRHLYKKGSIRSELTFFAYSNFLGSIRQVVYGEKTGKSDKKIAKSNFI